MDHMEFSYEEEYEQRRKRTRRHKKVILLSFALFFVLFLFLYLEFFSSHPLSYDELQLNVQEENGIIYTYATWTTAGGHVKGSLSDTSIYLDFENDVDYREHHFQLSASNWRLLRYPGTTRLIDKFYRNGAVVGSEGYVHHVDANGNSHYMEQRCGRLYYDNPDGTSVLIWECEDMPK